ncbi:MAG: M20/M25/M40 family metallo-hydrolase [Fervidicoccaceae archaeon]
MVELLSVYSPTGHEAEAVSVFVDLARGLGLDAWVDEAGNGLAAPPLAERRASVLLAGHIDTIEGFVEPREEGGEVSGRGAVDAKGPLASMLTALALLAERDPALPVAVAALVDEEGESRGARSLAERRRVPPFVVIGEPTGATRVAIGYRGGAKLRVFCEGAGGHPASPWAGDSALDKLLAFVLRLRELSGRSAREVTAAVTVLVAGSDPRALPETAECVVDLRVPPGFSVEEAVARIESTLERDCRSGLISMERPFSVRPQDPVPRSLGRALLELGLKPAYALKAGTSDFNVLGPLTESIAAYGPGDPSLAHTSLEKVSVDELALAVEVYLRAVSYLLSSYRPSRAEKLG